MTAETPEERWHRRTQRYLPVGLLALSTAVAMATGPATGALTPWPRLAAQLTVLVALAGWLLWRLDSQLTRVGYVLRSAAAFALTALNPLFCIFAWVGFTDADEVFRGRAVWLAMAATAVTMATGQSGGLPVDSAGHVALFLALLAVNFGVAYTVGRLALHQSQVSVDRLVAITELERVNASLQQALAENASLQETVVDQARAAGVQEERQRLAREIHDTIAQSLAGIVAQLQAAHGDTDPAAVRRRVDRAAELARAALVDARRSMMDLVPAPLQDRPLAEAVAGLVADWATDQPTEARCVVTGEVRPLHPELEVTLLRAVQESLANVAKHAAATRVGVTLSYLDDEVILDVRDDGAGFDPAARPVPQEAADSAGFGLRGMRQRAARLAGVLDIETEPGGGTAVSLRLPAIGRGAA